MLNNVMLLHRSRTVESSSGLEMSNLLEAIALMLFEVFPPSFLEAKAAC